MNDWYSSQDPKRTVLLQSFAAGSNKDCGPLPASSRTYAEAATVAQAWLVAYARCQEAQRSLGSALLGFQAPATLTEQSLRAAARLTERLRDVPVATPAH